MIFLYGAIVWQNFVVSSLPQSIYLQKIDFLVFTVVSSNYAKMKLQNKYCTCAHFECKT